METREGKKNRKKVGVEGEYFYSVKSNVMSLCVSFQVA